MFCAYPRPRYQVSVYRTIGPLVIFLARNTSEYYIPKLCVCLCTVLLSAIFVQK